VREQRRRQAPGSPISGAGRMLMPANDPKRSFQSFGQTMRFVTALLLALLSIACSAADPNERAIEGRLRQLAGVNAVVCGLVRQDRDPSAAWRCAQESDAARKPFWLAVEGRPTDSAVWHVVTRTMTGNRLVIFYTSNNHGGREFEPHFTEHECSEPFQFFEGRMFTLRCGPDVP